MLTLARLNFVVAANITALALSTQIWWCGYVPFPKLYLLMFAGITLAYFLFRIHWLFNKPEEGDGKLAEFLYTNRLIAGFLVILLGLAVLYLSVWEIPSKFLYFFIPVIIMAALYHMRTARRKRLRNSGLAKLLLIVLSVTWVSWVIPTLSFAPGTERDAADWPLGFLSRLLFILGITIPFDVRDIEEDRRKQVKTIAVLIGEKKSLRIAGFACFASLLMEILRWFNGGISGLNLFAMTLGLGASVFVVLESDSRRREPHFSVFVESLPGVVAFLLWALRL
jgi:4-hydroxybenzoate polyprenyltransferase